MKLLCKLFTALLLLVNMSVASAAVISFEPDSDTVNVGESFNVEVKIAALGADILTTFDFDMLFDNAILNFNSFTFGDAVNGNQLDISGLTGGLFASTIVNPGKINATDLSFDTDATLIANQLDEFVLGTLNFTANALGSAAFTFQNVILGGAFNGGFIATPIDFTANSATVNVVASSIDEPGALLLMFIGLATVVTQRRKTICK